MNLEFEIPLISKVLQQDSFSPGGGLQVWINIDIHSNDRGRVDVPEHPATACQAREGGGGGALTHGEAG